MQLDYNQTMSKAFAGMKADSQFDFVASLLGKESVKPGQGLVKFKGVSNAARLPHINKATVVMSASLVADDVVTCVVNGVTLTETYATSHAATMGSLRTKIAAVPGVLSAVLDTNTITVIASGNTVLTTTCSVANGGAGIAVATVTDLTTDELFAIALHSHTLTPSTYPYEAINDKAVIAFDADLITANVVTISVNGTTLGTVTFATSHANTMALVAARLMSATGVKSATVSGRTITVLAPVGLTLTIDSVVVTLGATQATATITASSQSQTMGEVRYDAEEAVNGLRKGRVYVEVEEAVTADDDVYLRYKASGDNVPGGWRASADSNTAVLVSGAKFVESASAGGVAVVEINLP